ncbi:hypothetical protein B0H66DRAFT_596403 [Apodospora peruviana]|uniref:Uncharacterized protein n=1 Tax=Apodospora peruviana TaxID=516989 RepID=A0AAE0MEH7_9PEZI|nr:hypothetical protein B0H66DRAFT_596403 [Apodospora peruviana]
MHLTSILARAIGALYLATSCHAWAKDGNGVWVANNVWYSINGNAVHEACTQKDTTNFKTSGYCAYWLDAQGHKFEGGE